LLTALLSTTVADLELVLLDEETFDEIPDPARPGARCQTCDYWERLDGRREPPASTEARRASEASKRRRLLASRAVAGSYAMVAYDRARGQTAVAYAQFGPLSAYPRAQTIRDRYPELPESPAPWVVTCLQVSDAAGDRAATARAVLDGVCRELDRRGITAVEAYPEGMGDPWAASPGPAAAYEGAGFERAAGDERYPVYRRELSGEMAADAWSGLIRAAGARDDKDDSWPLPLPSLPDADEVFRLPERPKRPNPFGED
jgi:hypothetical protein